MKLFSRALLGIALLAACEKVPARDALATQASAIVAIPRFSPEDPRLSVAHTGTRRFEFPRTSGPGARYRERIATDGRGRFALEPLQGPHTTQDEWDEFELRQRARQGFLFRYRDFLVREADLFERNWTTTDLLRTESVAGRTCDTYRVERNSDEPSVAYYEVALDQETGLVLASREYANGRLIADMVYESFQLDPDPDSIAWHQASNVERILPSVEALEQELRVQTLHPRLLPAGYAQLEVATVMDGADRTWLKLTYTDGVEPLFFLQALDDAEPEGSTAGIGVEKMPAPSSVMVFQLGTATAIQGRVEGYSLMVIGKVSEAELLDLIESCLP